MLNGIPAYNHILVQSKMILELPEFKSRSPHKIVSDISGHRILIHLATTRSK